jgi:hypothetical protein
MRRSGPPYVATTTALAIAVLVPTPGNDTAKLLISVGRALASIYPPHFLALVGTQ